MSILLWVLLIHIIELVAIGIFILIRKNIALLKVVDKQQEYINSLNILLSEMNDNLGKIDEKIYVNGDESLIEVFDNIREINETINSFYK
jgi:hypothetical protein